MFLSYGHGNVRVLNGGLKKWRAEGRPVESGEFKAKPATFKATYDPKRVRSIEQMVDNVASKAEQVIDARAAERFEGRAPEPRPGIRSGHIPGSRNVPYNQLFDAATGAMKPLDDLRKAFTRRRREARRADRDKLRLRRLGRRADARALPARRRRHRAL